MKLHFKKLDYYQWTDCALHTLSTDSSKVVYNFYFSKCMITEIDCLMLYYLEIVCVASLVIKIATSAFPRQLFCLLVMICTLFSHNITSCSLFLRQSGRTWVTKKQTTRCYIMRKQCAKHHQEENSYRGEAEVAIFIPSDAAHTIFS